LASIRHEQRRVSPSATNEFLKQIPRLREVRQHLLVCATNCIDRLDLAFLRPGHFDYVLPVGPPDGARKAAQRAFEREHFEGAQHRARADDFLRAIEQVRPTLTPEMLQGFDAARRGHARY
jgi:transitional endoplasmic reticulum ATPase